MAESSSGTFARLLASTRELRRQVDAELQLLGTRTSWLDYRLYLFRMYGFHAAVERGLGLTVGLPSVIPDAGMRNNKLALLAADLVSLGVERRDLAQLPRMPIPSLHELRRALGWMFVVEGSTLHGRDVIAHLTDTLPLEMEAASAYLSCYGAEVEARWARFGAALDAYATRPEVTEVILEGATDCLVRLHRWLRARTPGQVQPVSEPVLGEVSG